jgi:hypothetical protein
VVAQELESLQSPWGVADRHGPQLAAPAADDFRALDQRIPVALAGRLRIPVACERALVDPGPPVGGLPHPGGRRVDVRLEAGVDPVDGPLFLPDLVEVGRVVETPLLERG